MNNSQSLQHYGVMGMKWGKRKSKYDYDNTDVRIEKGTEIHRMVPKTWLDKEKQLSGRAYASYKPEDVERYKTISKLFGVGNYVDMTFKASNDIVSPSQKKRVDEFVHLMNSNPEAKMALIKGTRNPLLFMPKKRLNKLDNPKQAALAYRKFSFLLVSKRELRDPYFKALEDQGYSMMIDDADANGGISKSPIIVFDRQKSLTLDRHEII